MTRAAESPTASLSAAQTIGTCTCATVTCCGGLHRAPEGYPAFRDAESLTRYAARTARDELTCLMTIHPSQIDPINAAFTLSAAAIARARNLGGVQGEPGASALQIDGLMIDAPHLKQAPRLLERAGDTQRASPALRDSLCDLAALEIVDLIGRVADLGK